MQRSSSSIDVFTSCIGNVPRPAKRWGQLRTMPAISSLVSREVASASPLSSW